MSYVGQLLDASADLAERVATKVAETLWPDKNDCKIPSEGLYTILLHFIILAIYFFSFFGRL